MSQIGLLYFGYLVLKALTHCILVYSSTVIAGSRSTVGSASDSRARWPGFDTQSSHILSFLLPLIQEGQLSVTGESMCTKYCLTA